MARRHKPAPQKPGLNLTSMLDVVFLLIVFFILVTNFTAAEQVEMEVPRPDDSEAHQTIERNRIVINVVPEDGTGRVARLRVGIRDLARGDYGRLTALLAAAAEKNPDLQVDLRADASIDYAGVQPVMNAITAAGITRINLVAYRELN